MGKNVLDARFGAGKGNFRSLVWRLWATKHGDIYLKSMGAPPDKFSFHNSGECREAFTKESGLTPNDQSDRVLDKWVRLNPPEAGTNSITPLIYLQIPTDFLSRETPMIAKPQ